MALKDWKKTYESSKMIRFEKGSVQVEVYSEKMYGMRYGKPKTFWFLAVSSTKAGTVYINKDMVNKVKAISSAKSYMSKH